MIDVEALKREFEPTATVLDVGADDGRNWEVLKDYFSDIRAVEKSGKKIKEHSLKEKYRKVYREDILDFTFKYYDIIIMSNVLKHLPEFIQEHTLDLFKKRCKKLIW